MQNIIITYSDFVYALSIAVSFVLSAVCFIILKQGMLRDLSFRFLGIFGVIQGLYCGINLVVPSVPPLNVVEIARIIVGLVSMISLAVFAVRRNEAIIAERPRKFIYMLFFVLFFASGFVWKSAGFGLSMGMLIIAAGISWFVLTAFVMVALVRKMNRKIAGIRHVLAEKVVDIAGSLYMVSFGWSLFFRNVMVAVTGVFLLFVIFVHMAVFLKRLTNSAQTYNARRIRHNILTLSAVCSCATVIGLAITNYAGVYYRQQYERELLLNAAIDVASINPARAVNLSGIPQEEFSEDYIRLKKQLVNMQASNPDYRFVYLMRMKDNKVIFLVDSKHPSSPDYSHPGRVYSEASLALRSVFSTGRSLIDGPSIDRWGAWISVFVPVKDYDTNTVVAVLAHDVEAGQLYRYVRIRRLVVIIALLLLYFIFAGYLMYREIVRLSLEKNRLLEVHFQSIFEKAPEGIVIYAAESGKIIAVNSFFANLLGYPGDVLSRSRIHDMAGWNENSFQEHVDNVLQSEIAYIPELSMRQRGDGTIYVDVTSSPMMFKGMQCVLSFVRDISEKKKIERILHEAKEYSDLLFHIVPSAVFTVDKDGTITSWNKRAAELTGYSVFEVMGKHCLLFSETPCRQQCGLFAVGGHAINNKECTVQTKDGRIRVIMKNADYIRAADGSILGGIESFEDITDRKRGEEKLRQLSQAVEQSPSTVVITDSDGAIEYVNPRFTELTGYLMHEVIGLNPRFLKSGDKPSSLYKEMWGAVKSGRTWHGEFLNKKKNGDSYWEFAAISGIKDPMGNITHYLKVAEDISDRKQMEKFKDDFVNTVSHELRTPLTAIKESINIVYDGSTGPVSDDQKDFLETAKRNVDRLGRLINEVLDFQKLQAGVMKFEKKETDINNLIEEVRQTMQTIMNKKGLELRLDLAAGLPEVFVDRDKIIQVLVNLVNNAIKFTEKGSIIVQSMLSEQNYIKVSVVDTGIGIKKEDHVKLFQSFSQVSSSEYRKSGSTGLGLAICKEIIRQHGGKISVESEPGQGSTFYFILPVLDRRFSVRE